jgi:hypothetical protein
MPKQLPTVHNPIKSFGRLHKVTNRDPRFGSSRCYNRILIKNEKGVFETLMMTHEELERIRARAAKNPEEQLAPTFIDRIRAL